MITATKTSTGLCSTCESFASCKYPKYEGKPVIFCEEFDDYVRNGHVENPDAQAILTYVNVKPREAKAAAGLCANCALAGACVYQKAEGGIWHCEEYQ